MKPAVEELLGELRRERDALRERLKRIELAITKLEQAGASLSSLQETAVPKPAVSVGSLFDAPQRHSYRPLKPAEVVEKVAALLRRGKKPMTRSQIARELAASGTPLAGLDVNKNVGTILWRNPKTFVHLDKLGYWLADEELAGVYTPDSVKD